MGHFSYSCQLTGIPITSGTPVVIVVLKPCPLFDYESDKLKKYGKSSFITNEGPSVKFKPVWFPIKGTYDEYGGIENIEKDDNVEILEKFYDLTIEQLMGVVTSSRKDDGYDEDLKVVKKKRTYPKGRKKDEKHFDFYLRVNNEKRLECPQYFSKKYFVFAGDNKVEGTKEDFGRVSGFVGSPLTEEYINAAKENKLRIHVKELRKLNHAMFSSGRMYDLIGTSPQDGDEKAIYEMLKLALEVLKPMVEKDSMEEAE